MPTQFTAAHPGWGSIKVYGIQTMEDGTWEPEWEPLRLELEARSAKDPGGLEEMVDLIPELGHHDYLSLRQNYARPLIDAGALAPQNCLRRLPKAYHPCQHRATCPTWDSRKCVADHKNQPPCYDVGVECAQDALVCLNRIVELWRSDIWVFRWLT